MKVLLLHNYYCTTAPSGENEVFDTERKILKTSTPWDVTEIVRYNDDITDWSGCRKLGIGIRATWNAAAVGEVRATIQNAAPNIPHVHNTFPQFPSSGVPGS